MRFGFLTPKKEPEMSNINIGRVVLGGLVAGLVLNIGEFVLNDFMLGAQMKSFLAAAQFCRARNQLHRSRPWD